ncbi:MAG: MerR family transcriptional regulator [Dehalococcoidia bacterium]|nr:MerR family transcriptional regulator [Dehalococcoidia bacterium]
MLKIGDFSRLSRVSVKALRYYDEIGLLKPVEVDRFTGYRYYSAEQLPRLNRIVALKDLGLSLVEVAQLLDENLPPDRMTAILRGKQAELEQRLQDGQRQLARLEQWLKTVEKEVRVPTYEVVIKKVDRQKVVSVRDVIPTYGDIGRLFGEVFGYLGSQGVAPMGPPLAIYHDDEYREEDVDVEVAVPVAGKVQGNSRVKFKELPAVEQMASTIHRGDYSGFGQAYAALMGWIDKNGYRITDHCKEIYLQGPGQCEPASYVTEIQLPVEKA